MARRAGVGLALEQTNPSTLCYVADIKSGGRSPPGALFPRRCRPCRARKRFPRNTQRGRTTVRLRVARRGNERDCCALAINCPTSQSCPRLTIDVWCPSTVRRCTEAFASVTRSAPSTGGPSKACICWPIPEPTRTLAFLFVPGVRAAHCPACPALPCPADRGRGRQGSLSRMSVRSSPATKGPRFRSPCSARPVSSSAPTVRTLLRSVPRPAAARKEQCLCAQRATAQAGRPLAEHQG